MTASFQDRNQYMPLQPGNGLIKRVYSKPNIAARKAHAAIVYLLEEFEKKFAARFDHVLLDPCSGNGVIPCTASIYERGRIASVVATDIESASVAVTRQNMRLTCFRGLHDLHQSGELEDSKALLDLSYKLHANRCYGYLPYTVEKQNMSGNWDNIVPDNTITLIAADLPFGGKSMALDEDGNPLQKGERNTMVLSFLRNIRAKTRDNAVVGLITEDKKIDRDERDFRSSEEFSYVAGQVLPASKSKGKYGLRHYSHMLTPKT